MGSNCAPQACAFGFWISIYQVIRTESSCFQDAWNKIEVYYFLLQRAVQYPIKHLWWALLVHTYGQTRVQGCDLLRHSCQQADRSWTLCFTTTQTQLTRQVKLHSPPLAPVMYSTIVFRNGLRWIAARSSPTSSCPHGPAFSFALHLMEKVISRRLPAV